MIYIILIEKTIIYKLAEEYLHITTEDGTVTNNKEIKILKK